MDADLSVFLGNKLVWIICGGAAVLMLAAVGAVLFVAIMALQRIWDKAE